MKKIKKVTLLKKEGDVEKKISLDTIVLLYVISMWKEYNITKRFNMLAIHFLTV